VFGNGGNDKINMDLIADDLPPLPGRAVGGDGDDEITPPPDGRVGIAQPTTVLEGSGGNDKIVAGNGPVDTIPNLVNDYDRLFDDDVSITLDNQANDGEPGEGDNVIAVEKFNIVANHATVVGSDAAEDVFVESKSSTIRGLGGHDRLVTYDGNDDIDGGDGDDFLEGDFGNDTLTGGAGVDQFNGDRTESNVFAVGNDQIFARDGNVEQISCGLGSDTAQVDGGDVVDTSCESVDRGPFSGSEAFGAKTLVTLRLAAAQIPARGPLQRVLRSTWKLSLRLTVKVKDPAGNTRTVKKKVVPKLKR
jgi:Ca2+-binding RTX toxin-like protein